MSGGGRKLPPLPPDTARKRLLAPPEEPMWPVEGRVSNGNEESSTNNLIKKKVLFNKSELEPTMAQRGEVDVGDTPVDKEISVGSSLDEEGVFSEEDS